MALFKIDKTRVHKLLSTSVNKERDLQKLFEDNLETILDITFLAHEYSTSFGGRIDTLGIDANGAPVIIEYKKTQNDNVINQGLSYLRWLLDHKADFEKLLGDTKSTPSIDWDSPRVICVAESYNKFDIDTADILPINIELLRYRIYENSLLIVEPEKYEKVSISTNGITKKSTKEKTKQATLQQSYTIQDHLSNASDAAREIYEAIHEFIMSLDETIKVEPKKYYIAYKLTTNFVDVSVMMGKYAFVKLFLNVPSGKLNDPHGLARDVSNIGKWGNGDYEIKVDNLSSITKVFDLIKQSYDYNK